MKEKLEKLKSLYELLIETNPEEIIPWESELRDLWRKVLSKVLEKIFKEIEKEIK